MKKLTCHCGQIEAEINTLDKLNKFLDAIVRFAKEREQLCLW